MFIFTFVRIGTEKRSSSMIFVFNMKTNWIVYDERRSVKSCWDGRPSRKITLLTDADDICFFNVLKRTTFYLNLHFKFSRFDSLAFCTGFCNCARAWFCSLFLWSKEEQEGKTTFEKKILSKNFFTGDSPKHWRYSLINLFWKWKENVFEVRTKQKRKVVPRLRESFLICGFVSCLAALPTGKHPHNCMMISNLK